MNIVLSKNNHIKWGYNGILFSERSNPYDKFFTCYGNVKDKINLKDACIKTAYEITDCAETLKLTPLILFTGSLYSQAILYSFILTKKKFSVVYTNYTPRIYDIEYNNLNNLIKNYDLDVILNDINVNDFLSQETTFQDALRDKSVNIESDVSMRIAGRFKNNFFPIFDHPGIYLYRTNKNLKTSSIWYHKYFEYQMVYFNYCLNENINGCPSFFYWSPEIMYSFLTDPIIEDLVHQRVDGKINNKSSIEKLFKSTFKEFNFILGDKKFINNFVSKIKLNDIDNKLSQYLYFDKQYGVETEYFSFLKMLIGQI